MDLAIGTAPSAVSTGELSWFPFVMDPNAHGSGSRAMTYCSCGSPIASCGLWSSVRDEFVGRFDLAEFQRSTILLEKRASAVFALAGYVMDQRRVRAHAEMMGFLVRSVASHANARTIVDSTKLFSRGWLYLLLHRYGIDVRFIHLVRDGTRHIESRLVRRDPGEERPSPPSSAVLTELVSSFDWIYQNVLSSLAGFVMPERYLRVRYEDLIAQPTATMQRIGQFLGLDVRDVCDRLETGRSLAPGHAVAGNRLKFQPVLRAKAVAGTEASAAPRRFLLFRLIAGWLQKVYGYSPRGGLARQGGP